MRSPSLIPSIDWRARRLASTTVSVSSSTITASRLSSISTRPRLVSGSMPGLVTERRSGKARRRLANRPPDAGRYRFVTTSVTA